MKKKVLGLLLSISMIATMLVGCGSNSDSGSTDLNTEKQISAKNFNKSVEAFKEFYDEFYEEHRFNGSYEETEDCIANIYMIGSTPVMAILDMLAPSEDYFTADLYLYEYVDKEVQEKAKYSSLRFGDDEIYLYPLQDKLFMVYFDEEREQRVAELDEYFTELNETYYVVPEEGHESDFEENVQSDISKGIKCDDYEEFVEEVAGDNSAKKIVYYETDLGDDNFGGSYMLVDRGIQAYCLNTIFNYALVVDWGLTDKDGDDGFIMYDTSFKKYLDYLLEQEITNNVQLLLTHADYLDSIGLYDDYWSDGKDGQQIDTVVWFDGIYYYIVDDTAYVLGYDFGYSEDDLPKSICGLGVEASAIDILLDYAGGNSEAISDTEKFPISYAKRESVEDMWEQVAVAKEEYKQSVGAALEAYEDYIDEKDLDGSDYRYAFIYVDDNDVPELYVENEWGHTVLLTYSNGQVLELELDRPWDYFGYYEKQGFITTSYSYMGGSTDYIYSLKDGVLTTLVVGTVNEDFDTFELTYRINNEVVSESEYNNSFDSVRPEGESVSVGIWKDNVYSDFDDACEEAGIIN